MYRVVAIIGSIILLCITSFGGYELSMDDNQYATEDTYTNIYNTSYTPITTNIDLSSLSPLMDGNDTGVER